jgi:CheY-like chemotaxis protein
MCNRDVILCVDDEENQLTMRTLLLESKGYSVVPASSGREALDLLACYPVDLVLSDHLMPGLTGAELARLIKLASPELPVILISALVDTPAGAEFADLFMSKLDGPVVMCDNVASMLERARSRALARKCKAC